MSEHKAFEILVRQHHRRLMAYALSLAAEPSVAEDLVQDALVTAFRKLPEFDASRDFGAWVRGIIRMKHLESSRGHRERALEANVLEALEARHVAWDRAAGDGRDAIEALQDCLARLTAEMRAAVDGFYVDRRSCTEIAAQQGAGEDVVRKRLQRARESLAECVERNLEERA